MSRLWGFLKLLIEEGEEAAREMFPGATIESSKTGYIVTVPHSTPLEQEKQPKQ